MSAYEYRYIARQEYLTGGQLKWELWLERRRQRALQFLSPWGKIEFLGFHRSPKDAQDFADRHKANGGREEMVLPT